MAIEVVLNLVGAVAILIWGLRMVQTGITRAWGTRLRQAIGEATRNRMGAFGIGIVVTTILQSSTAAGLMIVSFAGSGAIALTAGLAAVLGADLGSTLVVQALSLDLHWLAPLLAGVGVAIFLTSSGTRPKNLGRVAIGLGLVLLSIRLIVSASEPLRSSETLALILGSLSDEPMLALLIAALLTYVIHSSVAVVVLIMSLASTGVLSFPLSLALVLGANLGGAVVPVVLTSGRSPAARRIPLGNLAMRATGILIALLGLPWLTEVMQWIDPDPGRLVANSHTALNLALAIVWLPLLTLVARVLCLGIPDRTSTGNMGHPTNLDDDALELPTVALACAARETLRMGDTVESMLTRTMIALRGDDEAVRRAVQADDDMVDDLHEAIKVYLTRMSREELDEKESNRIVDMLAFATNLEHIGDIIDKNLMDLAARKCKHHVSFSTEGMDELEDFHRQVLANLRLSLSVFISGDLEAARELLRQKSVVRATEYGLVERHFARLEGRRPDSMESSSLHLDVLRDLKRINSHITAVAYPILERAGLLTDSRLKQSNDRQNNGALQSEHTSFRSSPC